MTDRSIPADFDAGRRRILRQSVALALGTAITGIAPAFAQGYPSRAIRIIVPWGPGGLVDIGGRVVGDALQKAFDQATAVENVPGAAGTLGAHQVAKAGPDGHTLLMGTSSIALDVAGGRAMPFEPLRDLAPVALVADTYSVLIVPLSSPFKSVAELVAAAKAKPGALSYGTPGIGSPAHLFSELFAQTAGINMLHVPYGRAPALNDLMGGRLDVMFATIPIALAPIKSAQVRPLAVTSARRFPLLPDVATVAEAGVPGYQATQWLGVFAPAATPSEIVQRLNAEITRAIGTPAVAQALQARGLDPRTASPDEFRRVLAADIVKWGQVIRAGNIKLA
jgi:tripartite-type tricarboxylate transporter receptor subunit TctC